MIDLAEFDSACGALPDVAGVVPLASFDSMTIMILGCKVLAKQSHTLKSRVAAPVVV